MEHVLRAQPLAKRRPQLIAGRRTAPLGRLHLDGRHSRLHGGVVVTPDDEEVDLHGVTGIAALVAGVEVHRPAVRLELLRDRVLDQHPLVDREVVEYDLAIHLAQHLGAVREGLAHQQPCIRLIAFEGAAVLVRPQAHIGVGGIPAHVYERGVLEPEERRVVLPHAGGGIEGREGELLLVLRQLPGHLGEDASDAARVAVAVLAHVVQVQAQDAALDVVDGGEVTLLDVRDDLLGHTAHEHVLPPEARRALMQGVGQRLEPLEGAADQVGELAPPPIAKQNSSKSSGTISRRRSSEGMTMPSTFS